MTKPKRPLILTIISIVLIAQSILWPIIIALFMFGGFGTTMLYNEQEVLVSNYKVSIIFQMLLGWLLASIIGFGLWYAKVWSRVIVLSYFIFIFFYLIYIAISTSRNLSAFLTISLLSIIYLVYWYFFKKANVRSYFGAT